ncbi:MAG: hypothetical protein JWO36_7086 [Myxococcales bacterium]|nr:hypothetical protein [Myxococcales bacterium]
MHGSYIVGPRYGSSVTRWPCLLLLAAACRLNFAEQVDAQGSDVVDVAAPPLKPWWTSGTRFRARLYVPVEGGDPVFAGFRDTLLDTDCASAPAADGIERCVPNHANAQTFYSDATCTQRLAQSYASPCGHDRFASVTDTNGNLHIYPFAALYTGIAYDVRAGCTNQGVPPNSVLHQVGTEMPPTMFAKAVYEDRLVGDNSHVFLGFGDGSSLDLGTLAFQTGSCSPKGAGELGVTQCRDTSPPLQPVFADAGCTQRGFLAGDLAVISRFHVDDITLCGRHSTNYGVIGTFVTPTYWTRDTTGCVTHAIPATSSLYAAAQVADPYPTGTTAPGPRHGRLGNLYWTTSDGISISIATWDNDLQQSCVPFMGTDGVFRCLPRQPKLVDAFSNTACMGPMTQLAAACYGVPPLDGPNYTTCDDPGWEVRDLATVPSAQILDEAVCRPLVAPGSVYQHRTGSVVIPPATFPELVETIE